LTSNKHRSLPRRFDGKIDFEDLERFEHAVILDAMTLIKYYKARFQIEFLFRDAKQYTGLTHCQSWRKEAINMQH